jgi:hypothetical protein
LGNFKQKQKKPGTITGHGGFDLPRYQFNQAIADGFWNSVQYVAFDTRRKA